MGGDGRNDVAELRLYSNQIGTFDLATGINSDSSTCNQCIFLYQDEANETVDKIFYQDRGVFSSQTAPGTNPYSVQLINVRLVEVAVDDSGYATPVPGGECYEQAYDSIFSNGFDQ